jgi:hypothetical protein
MMRISSPIVTRPTKAEKRSANKPKPPIAKVIEKAEKASERYPDFQSVVSNPAAHQPPDTEFISESDAGADRHFLARTRPKPPAGLSPMKAARELTRIELSRPSVRLSRTSSASPTA